MLRQTLIAIPALVCSLGAVAGNIEARLTTENRAFSQDAEYYLMGRADHPGSEYRHNAARIDSNALVLGFLTTATTSFLNPGDTVKARLDSDGSSAAPGGIVTDTADMAATPDSCSVDSIPGPYTLHFTTTAHRSPTACSSTNPCKFAKYYYMNPPSGETCYDILGSLNFHSTSLVTDESAHTYDQTTGNFSMHICIHQVPYDTDTTDPGFDTWPASAWLHVTYHSGSCTINREL